MQPAVQNLSQFRNSEITIDVSVKGRREDANVPEEVLSSDSKKVRLISGFALTPSVMYSTGPFTNSGPIPPKADTETTYTVSWILTNSINDVGNAVVSTTLPSYVKWVGKLSPQDENITYDQNSRTVTWNAGLVGSGSGYSGAAKQAAFQISFLPSLSQAGQVPNLTGEMTLTGDDRHANVSLRSTKAALTTRLNMDPAYKRGDETVVR
jgi:hypothetical protein